MKKLFSLLLLFFILSSHGMAEKVNTVAEIYDTEFSNQAIAYLERGAEIWVEEDKGGKRVKIYAKVWLNRKQIKRGVTEANAALFDRNGKPNGGLYIPQTAVYDTTSSFSHYALVLRGYIFKDRIDPGSIIEKSLANLLDPKKGKITKEQMGDFFKAFTFVSGADTMDYTFLHYYDRDEIRLTLVFKDNRLIAVVPKKDAVFKYYIAEQKQTGIRIIYFEKLPAFEEQFLGDYLK